VLAEYRANAEECRKPAKEMTKPEDIEILERMAETSETLRLSDASWI
jgi:hypothetical protein